MKNNDWYIVEDIDALVLSTRKLVFHNFGKSSIEDVSSMYKEIDPSEQEEFDNILGQQECILIAKNQMKQRLDKKTKTMQYILNDKAYSKILEDIHDRMISNILHNLVKRGLIETAFDEQKDDFVFWVRGDDQDTKTN